MLNQILTSLMKKIILELGLIDTGSLYNSILVYSYIQNNVLYIDVKSEDYIVYLKDRYNISGRFTDNDIFGNEIGSLIAPIIEEGIVKAFNEGKVFDFDPKIILLYNGN